MMKVNSAPDRGHYPTRTVELKETRANKANNNKEHPAVGKEIKEEYIPSKQKTTVTYEKPTYKPDTETI
ncbi:MAG: hypothetical protein JJT76_10500 [Clostridiaceae bacterium]|nr:hypothetical protein [Clostridiaceae bacterium]